MSKKTFKAWITKYALTTGVTVCKVEQHHQFNSLVSEVSKPWGPNYHGEGRDWHRTRESAIARVEEMRTAAIKAAQRKLDKLTTMRVEVPR